MDIDPVVAAYLDRLPLVDRLGAIQVEQARTAAELSWMRLHAADYGEDLLEAARAVSRRVRALRRLAELDLAHHRATEPEGIDLGSPEGQQALCLLFDRIVGVAADVLPGDVADALVERFTAALAADPDIPWVAPPQEEPLPDSA